MKKKLILHNFDGIFILLLFALFAGSLLLVLLTGAGSYKRVAERDAETYARSTCSQYIAAKVRHADRIDGVKLGSFTSPEDPQADDISTLYLLQEIDGVSYATRVYWYDGEVRELFSEMSLSMNPEDGNQVMEAEELSFRVQDGMLEVTSVGASGAEDRLLLSLRSGEGAVS